MGTVLGVQTCMLVVLRIISKSLRHGRAGVRVKPTGVEETPRTCSATRHSLRSRCPRCTGCPSVYCPSYRIHKSPHDEPPWISSATTLTGCISFTKSYKASKCSPLLRHSYLQATHALLAPFFEGNMSIRQLRTLLHIIQEDGSQSQKPRPNIFISATPEKETSRSRERLTHQAIRHQEDPTHGRPGSGTASQPRTPNLDL